MSRFDEQIKLFISKGLKARSAHIALNNAFKDGLRDQDPKAYANLLTEFRAATIAASPNEIKIFQNQESIDSAIAFLAADAYYFRSGYLKQALLRKLKHMAFDKAQTICLANLVINRIKLPNQFQFSDYVKLVPFLNSIELENQVFRFANDSDAGIRHRAQIMLNNIQQHHKNQKRNLP